MIPMALEEEEGKSPTLFISTHLGQLMMRICPELVFQGEEWQALELEATGETQIWEHFQHLSLLYLFHSPISVYVFHETNTRSSTGTKTT